MEDGWQRLRLTLHAPGSDEFWVAPIDTVSESEGGFERVYQGSQILALWRPDADDENLVLSAVDVARRVLLTNSSIVQKKGAKIGALC